MDVALWLMAASLFSSFTTSTTVQGYETMPEVTPSPMAHYADQQTRADIEQQREQIAREAENTLDKDAIEVLQQTHNVIKAIEASKHDDAVAAIKRAQKQIELLLQRNSTQVHIPVHVEVAVFDTAPEELSAIIDIAQDASRALDDKDFPSARVLLHSLMSEIRVREYNLPLTTFPTALQEAQRLLEQNKTSEARAVLLTALRTLVALDRVVPIPLLAARAAIKRAQANRSDAPTAQQYLHIADHEVDRARYLGYAGSSPEYTALKDEIAKLEKQLKGEEDLSSVFSELGNRLATFLRWQSEHQHS